MMSPIYKETDKATARIVLKVQNLTFFILMFCTTVRDNIGNKKQTINACTLHASTYPSDFNSQPFALLKYHYYKLLRETRHTEPQRH